jgi:hypothetical protein
MAQSHQNFSQAVSVFLVAALTHLFALVASGVARAPRGVAPSATDRVSEIDHAGGAD